MLINVENRKEIDAYAKCIKCGTIFNIEFVSFKLTELERGKIYLTVPPCPKCCKPETKEELK